jgi:hypothetical protein
MDEKVLLVMNVFIVDSTDEAEFKKLLKTLQSYKPFSKYYAVLNIELQSHSNSAWKLIEEICFQTFENYTLSNHRISTRRGWLDLLELYSAYHYFIFLCNHDHVLISDLESHLVEYITFDRRSFETTLSLSHWPEMINSGMIDKEYLEHGFIYEGQNVDSVQVVPRTLLIKWFEPEYLENVWLPRSDPPYSVVGKDTSVKSINSQKIYVPYKEILAHMDAYEHFRPGITLKDAPKIGFADNVRVRYSNSDNNNSNVLKYSRLKSLIYSYYLLWPPYGLVKRLLLYNSWYMISPLGHINISLKYLPLRFYRIFLRNYYRLIQSL